MTKVGIITIIDNNNYGNRLQNYAIQTILNDLNVDSLTIVNSPILNNRKKYVLRFLKFFWKNQFDTYDSNIFRKKAFTEFNNLINFTKKNYTIFSKFSFDTIIVGSDQVWNPKFGRLSDLDLLNFKSGNKIAFSASFGINELPNFINKKKLLECFNNFDRISVREDSGKKILEDLGYKEEISVLIDPTMLLTADQWDKISRKPKMLKSDRYVLNYFLGTLSKQRKKEIDRIAKENNCEVIDILDKNSPFYACGPSEFLYLEKHAFLICTDSFHSSVFAVIYDKPFIIFNREQENVVSMNARLDTLIKKLKLENRKYNEICITEENLNHDYTKAYNQLKIEKEKSVAFLRSIIVGK